MCYLGIILSDISHDNPQTDLRNGGQRSVPRYPVCHELGYTHFSTVITVSINLLVILQGGAGNVFLQQADASHLTQTGHCTAKLCKLHEQTVTDQ